MISKTKQYGHIEGGKLHITNRKRFAADMSMFKDCDVEIIIKKKGKRSTQQNRYYWGAVVEEIRIEFERRGDRFTPEEIHEGLKAKFNPKTIADKSTGEVIFQAGDSTTEMNKDEFGEYIERVKEWAASSLEIYIPDANEQTKLFAA